MTQLVLSLFPGIGLLDMAFEQEGFCVVRGPDVLWGGDVRRFHPPAGKFDGIIGGPPCQAFSRLAHMVRHNGYEPKFGNLIPEFERCVREAQPQWFVMENVPDAPVPCVTGYDAYSYILNNRQCMDDNGEPAIANRLRRFTWGWRGQDRPPLMIDLCVFENREFAYCGGDPATTLRKRRGKQGTMPWNHKGAQGFRDACKAQGLPADFDLPPFTVAEKCHAVRNGVPIPMGRAIAKAVKEAVDGNQKV